jgi:uncharacterized damage-inducible protein DinB
VNRIFMAALLSAALHAQSNPYTADVRQVYERIKGDLLRAADRMPEEHYAFRTTPEVRSYAEMIAHVADAQKRMCGVVKGEPVTADAASKTSKAGLVAALKASFAYCDPVYDSMTDAAGASKVKWARWVMTRLGLLNFNVSHDNEMYGVIAAYLRIKGLVPPSTEARPQAGAKK